MSDFIRGFHGVRYITTDIQRAVSFYTGILGFKLDHQQLPAFASVSLGPLVILLTGPGASGSRALSDGSAQLPGGSTRVVLRVDDLEKAVEACRNAGVRFRSEMLAGPGGKQMQLLDPDGNPVELFEPVSRAATSASRSSV